MKHQVIGNMKDGTQMEISFSSGDIFIDCGANVGDVTDTFAHLGMVVFAFEPNKTAYDILVKRYAEQKNVKCYMSAVSTYNGVGKLYLHEKNEVDPIAFSTGSSLNSEKVNVSAEDYEEVGVVDLSEVIEKIKKASGKNIHILKIDIEGAECEVVEKLMDKNLLDDIEYVLIETHEQKNPSLIEPTRKMIERAKSKGLKNVNFNWV